MVCTSSHKLPAGFEVTSYEGLLNFNVNHSYMGSSGQNQPHHEHLRLQALGNLLMDFQFPYMRNLFCTLSAFAFMFIAGPICIFRMICSGPDPPFRDF